MIEGNTRREIMRLLMKGVEIKKVIYNKAKMSFQ